MEHFFESLDLSKIVVEVEEALGLEASIKEKKTL